MFGNFWLFCKRILLLVPGIAATIFAAHNVLPYFEKHIPLWAAILPSYVLVAYGIIPAVIRSWRFFFPTKHLPLYCITPDGFASDPINIGLIGSRTQLIEAMEASGWHMAKPLNLPTILATIGAVVLKRSYERMPISPLFLFGRPQDLAFERQLLEEGRGHRHHVRFWATTLSDIESGLDTARPLSRREQAVADKMLWAGAASRDIGISFIAGTLQLTHLVSPDTNHERGLLTRELEVRGLAETVSVMPLHQPYDLPNRAGWARILHTDGKMTLLRLKN